MQESKVQKLLNSMWLKVIHYPRQTILVCFVVLVSVCFGLANLSLNNDFRVYLSEKNPQLKAFEAFERKFVKSDSATLVITAKQGDIFTKDGLALIRSLTDQLWQLDYVSRVDSLSNYVYTEAYGDNIESQFLIADDVELTQEKVSALRTIALSKSRLNGHLITPDGKLALIFATLNFPANVDNPSLSITKAVEALRDNYREKYPHFQIDNGGSTALNATLARAVTKDLTTLVPLSYVIIFAGLLFFLRSLFGAMSIFILVTLCIVTTFGVFGWLAPVLTPIAGFAPSVLLSIMVADCVHILITYYQNLQKNQPKPQALLASLQFNFMPVLITSVTTILGFLTLNFSRSPPYQDLGNMVAFGVFIAFLLSITLLPALIMALPTERFKPAKKADFFPSLAKKIIAHRSKIFLSVTTVIIALTLAIPNNRLTDNWARYFDDSFEIMQLVKRIDGYLSGINALEYAFESNVEGGIFEPEFLRQLDAFEAWLLDQEKVFKVSSITALMKDLNQLMHGDDPAFNQIPQDSELAAQYLLFYEFGLPQGVDLTHQVSMDKSTVRLSVSITDAGSDELLKLDEKAQLWLANNAPAIKAQPATGLGVVFAHIAQRNILSLLQGTLVAFMLISLLLMFVFRSIKLGLISLVPNLIPAAMAYGFWGVTFGYVDIALSIVACATLGIVVDDTVHFLYKYSIAKKHTHSVSKAIVETFSNVGLALFTTTLVLAVGFSILAFSAMNTSAAIGILMAITLLFALMVDYFLLPPLLLKLDKPR